MRRKYYFNTLILSVGDTAAPEIVCLTELPRRVRKVVRSEYQFIVASGRLKQDIDLEKADAR